MMSYLDEERLPPCKRCGCKVGYRALAESTSRRMPVTCEHCGSPSPVGKALDKKLVVPAPDFGDTFFNVQTGRHWVWNGVRWCSSTVFNRSLQELCKLRKYAFSEWELRLLRVVDA